MFCCNCGASIIDDTDVFCRRCGKPYATGTYYDTLGVAQTATKQEIRSAYHRLIVRYHPDHNSDPGAAESTRQLNEVEIARNFVESQRPSTLVDYATATPLATGFLEAALAKEASKNGISR